MSGPFGSQQWMYNASSGFYPYELNNSLKFEDGDSSYLSRTPASAGNRKTFTWSGWFKRANLTNSVLLSAGTSNTARTLFYFDATNGQLYFFNNASGTITGIYTSAYYRDVSSFYHVVLAVDTTQTNASDRAKIYINGVEQAVSTYIGAIALNADLYINATNAHGIGAQAFGSAIYSDGYLAEVNFIDGTALTPSSFGETKEGIWIPKKYSGSYGTNGFYLPFKETTTANGFNTVTYTGNNSTRSITGVGFQPDFVWFKGRSHTLNSGLIDSVRGATKLSISNATNAEQTFSDELTSFDADGFSLGASSAGYTNYNNYTYVAWCWDAGTGDKTYIVTVYDSGSGNKYRFDGNSTDAPTLNLAEGATYTFNYPSAHPLRFSTTSNGTHSSGSEYTTGVTHVSSTQTTITIASGAPTLYYYCSIHSGMGGQINTNSTQGSSHLEGSIISTVKANQEYGFSVVSYTGNGSDGATVSHGLSQTPEMIIIKKRENNAGGSTGNWIGQHIGLATDPEATSSTFTLSSYTNGAIYLNLTNGQSSYGFDHQVNGNTDTFVAYCFHSVSGYQKIGSYGGTGSSGNAFTTGFKPAFLLIKRIDTAGYNWLIHDNTRYASDPNRAYLTADTNGTEQVSGSDLVSFTSTGFELKTSDAYYNASGGSYIYLAIADTRDALFTSDASGNGNNWTSNALQHSDVMPDTPTDGFAVLSNITSGGVGTFTEGNLQYQGASGQWESKISTIGVSSGKWYFEVNPISGSSSQGIMFGLINMSDTYLGQYFGYYGNTWGYYGNNGKKYNNAIASSYGATVADGDIVGVALDADAGTLTFYKNNVSQGVAYSGLSLGGTYDQEWFLGVSCYGSAKVVANFGQDSSFNANKIAQGNADGNGKGDFFYAPPSGYLALCNANLPNPAIDPNKGDNPENYFNTVFYSGNSGTNAVTGVGFQPNWTWVKSRNTSGEAHKVVDSVRGAGKTVFPSSTSAEIDYSGVGLNSFDTDGFTVSHSAANNQWNVSGRTYVAWNWLAGGTGVTNDDGSIQSTVSANTDAGFSIVKYVGDGNTTATIGHGLGVAPKMFIVKYTSTTSNWIVYHVGMGNTGGIQLNLGNAFAANSQYWGNTTPTSSVFTIGAYGNASSTTAIAYCFAEKEGYSKFGSYTGNGSTDGPFVYTGFRPAFIMTKRTDTSGNWWEMVDTAREPVNPSDQTLYANVTDAEYTNSVYNKDLLSNGFKMRGTNGGHNASGGTYIYMAFAEQPFKYSNAR